MPLNHSISAFQFQNVHVFGNTSQPVFFDKGGFSCNFPYTLILNKLTSSPVSSNSLVGFPFTEHGIIALKLIFSLTHLLAIVS